MEEVEGNDRGQQKGKSEGHYLQGYYGGRVLAVAVRGGEGGAMGG